MISRYKYIYLISCQSCWQSPPPLSINLWVSDTCHLQDAEINESSPRPIEKKWHQGTEGQTGHPVGNGGNNVPTSRVWRAATSCLLDFLVTSHSKSLTRIKWRFSYFRSISLYRWPRPQDTPPPPSAPSPTGSVGTWSHLRLPSWPGWFQHLPSHAPVSSPPSSSLTSLQLYLWGLDPWRPQRLPYRWPVTFKRTLLSDLYGCCFCEVTLTPVKSICIIFKTSTLYNLLIIYYLFDPLKKSRFIFGREKGQRRQCQRLISSSHSLLSARQHFKSKKINKRSNPIRQ